MKSLSLKATEFTPFIALDPSTHHHEIKGESYPENSVDFYQPVLEWLEKYLSKLKKKDAVIFDFEIVYFNSSTSKILMDVFDMLEDAAKDGRNITVNWRYDAENDAAYESGEEFAEDMEHITFNIIEIG